ncbi:MAG: hypothetical protein ACE5L7_09775, partial [Candidatus Aminicenantales bacterium]
FLISRPDCTCITVLEMLPCLEKRFLLRDRECGKSHLREKMFPQPKDVRFRLEEVKLRDLFH